jgi:hypothetical protein
MILDTRQEERGTSHARNPENPFSTVHDDRGPRTFF